MALLGLGNPLLDISVTTDEKFLSKYGLEANNAILAEEKHMPMYPEMAGMPGVEYLAGGATQNTIRVAQWILGAEHKTFYFGSVGTDEYSSRLKEKAEQDGLCVRYQSHAEHATGTCAVVVTQGGKCRSLVANLAAANHFTKDHIELPENQAVIQQSSLIYISGFFLTVSPDTIVAVGEHAKANNKTFCMNLSAPFLCEFFKDPMMKAFPYTDFVFGNETEAAKFSEVQALGCSDLQEIALKMSQLPKANAARSRTVVITQGAGEVIVAKDGAVQTFPVVQLSDAELVDTNGAGDAFVGGYLAELLRGQSAAACVRCGIWAARHVIRRPGCSFPHAEAYVR